MDRLRERLAAVPQRRRLPLALAAGAAVLVLVAAVLVAAGQASGSTTERPAVAEQAVAPTPAATASPLLVHVVGAVRHPGLVALPAGSRLIDAITAAGGPAAAADLGAVNLAGRVADGQQVAVPKRGAAPSAAPSAAAGASTGPISLSTATADQLDTLPRIGPALAARIVAYRQAHGPFASVGDLARVGGIGPKTIAGLRELVTP